MLTSDSYLCPSTRLIIKPKRSLTNFLAATWLPLAKSGVTSEIPQRCDSCVADIPCCRMLSGEEMRAALGHPHMSKVFFDPHTNEIWGRN